MSPPWEGLLLIDKPPGPTSHDIVDRVRRATGQPRVGHAGTLDPPASGLLPLVLGRATRLVRFLPHSPKTYTGSLQLGLVTDSDDITGEPLSRHDGPWPGEEAVLEAARGLVGRQRQVPPRVSARKVGGRRMYRLAREGVSVAAAPNEIEVLRFDLRPTAAPDVYRFEAGVSGGTYVRALVRDLGSRLGCGGTLRELRRTAVGPMLVEHATAPPPDAALDLARLIPPERMPLMPPPLRLDDPEGEARFVRGGTVEVGRPDLPEGYYRVTAASGRLLGVAEKRGTAVRPRVVLA